MMWYWYALVIMLLPIVAYFSFWNWQTDPMRNTAYLKTAEKMIAALPKVEQKFAVIGGGFCGLGVAAALKRHDIPFEILERDDNIGGNWYSGVYETVHIISSRKTTEYKDFPMPESYPDFPSKDQMFAYLLSYMKHWKLDEHLQLNTEVKNIATTVEDDDGAQGWNVSLADGTIRTYGGVIVCNGHHWDRRWAGPYAAQDTFTGEVMHSKQFKGPAQLKGKRVLTIGGGNSACDISVEAARFADHSAISQRRGYWFLPRVVFGFPLTEAMPQWMPVWGQRIILRLLLAIVVGPYERYGLQHPDHNIWDRHPTINSELLNFLKLGRIIPYPDIDRYLGGKKVRFVDGREAEFDLIVHATGYHVSLPLLAPGIVNWFYPKGKTAVDKKTDATGSDVKAEAKTATAAATAAVVPTGGTFDGRQYPDLMQGLVPLRHRNLFIFGLGQPRYGAGPLITAGATTLAALIRVQQSLAYPLGQVMQKVGAKPTTNYLQDPVQVFGSAIRSLSFIPRLPQVERWFLPKHIAGTRVASGVHA